MATARPRPGVAVEVRSADGTTVLATLPTIVIPGQGAPTPQLPDTIPPPTERDGREAVRTFTVSGENGGRYRVRASLEEGATRRCSSSRRPSPTSTRRSTGCS